jgi:hypothetical protein
MKNIAETLDEREEEYGRYADLSDILESIIEAYTCSKNWVNMEPYQRVALYMDAMKTARILNGNPDNIDSWHDKAGYSELVVKELMWRRDHDK